MSKIKKQKLIYIYTTMIVSLLVMGGITYAVFSDKGKVLGTTFSVGSADIKLLQNLTLGINGDNLKDEIAGPVFDNISPNWNSTYLVKVYNNSPTPVILSTYAYYETANDPAELRSLIYVEPVDWNDENSNGLLDTGEEGTSLGKKTIVKWKTEGFTLGQVESGEIKSVILKFSTSSIADSKQGSSGIFDFEFNSVGVE